MELADEYGLIICVENSMDVNLEPLRALLRETSAAQVQICLDIGHANYAQVPLEQWFDELGSISVICIYPTTTANSTSTFLWAWEM